MTQGEGKENDLEFIADCMLGRLARWLRILGFDTLYYSDIDDAALADIAEKENRTILTRDTRLTERKNVKQFLIIRNDDIQMQLKQVVSAYKLRIAPSIESMRCPACNGHLTPEEKSSVRGRVPLYIFRARDRFKKCAGCGKIYWKGSHYEKIRAKIHLFP